MLNTVLLVLAVWLILLLTDSPVPDYVARAWPLARDGVVSLLESVWHFLGG